jgi:hypothetical protein
MNGKAFYHGVRGDTAKSIFRVSAVSPCAPWLIQALL